MSKGSGSFFAFIFGIITGGILGLLFAPEKGSSTRDKLSFLADKYRKQLETIMADIMAEKEHVSSEAKAEGEKIISDAKEKAEKLLDDVNDLIGKIQKS